MGTQLFRPCFNDAGNHSLLNDGVTAGTDTSTEKQIGNITAAHNLIINEISRIALTGQLALYRHFGILSPCSLKLTVTIVKYQFDTGTRCRTAGIGTVKNHVLHAFAAQLPGRSFSQHPAHSINHIAFATAVWPDYRYQSARYCNRGGINKGFKAGKLNMG